jgi:hypothetical protein
MGVIVTSVGGQGAHGTTSGPVAEDVLDQEVVRGVLDSDALVLVADFNIVDTKRTLADLNT